MVKFKILEIFNLIPYCLAGLIFQVLLLLVNWIWSGSGSGSGSADNKDGKYGLFCSEKDVEDEPCYVDENNKPLFTISDDQYYEKNKKCIVTITEDNITEILNNEESTIFAESGDKIDKQIEKEELLRNALQTGKKIHLCKKIIEEFQNRKVIETFEDDTKVENDKDDKDTNDLDNDKKVITTTKKQLQQQLQKNLVRILNIISILPNLQWTLMKWICIW